LLLLLGLVDVRRNVEPGTIARLPPLATHITELGGTVTLHVVTSFAQLHHGSTIVAALPAVFLAHGNHAIGVGVVCAVPASVPAPPTFLANFCLAFRAGTVIPADGMVGLDVFGFNPFTAAFCRAVEPVVCGVFEVFFVPEALELVAE